MDVRRVSTQASKLLILANFKPTGVSRWHRGSISISIVAESVVKTTGTMDRRSSAAANRSPVSPSTTVPATRCTLQSEAANHASDIPGTGVSSFPHAVNEKPWEDGDDE